MAKRATTGRQAGGPEAPARRGRGRVRAPRPEGLPGELGAVVEGLREARGWSSADLARAARLGAGTVIRVEAGRVSPSLETVLALAHALEFSGEALLAECPHWKMKPKKGV